MLFTRGFLTVATEPEFLDIISVNFWNILIALLNLVVLFLLVKAFLFKPVRALFAERQKALDEQYGAAAEAQRQADENRAQWEQTLAGAHTQAKEILQSATDSAKYREEKIVSEAQEKARGIVKRAEQEAELERRRAADDIKREIVEVSGALAEKMLQREINVKDHSALIDAMIEQVGESDE